MAGLVPAIHVSFRVDADARDIGERSDAVLQRLCAGMTKRLKAIDIK
jgi:hypothetical protein